MQKMEVTKQKLVEAHMASRCPDTSLAMAFEVCFCLKCPIAAVLNDGTAQSISTFMMDVLPSPSH